MIIKIKNIKHNIGCKGFFSGATVYLFSNILAAAIPFALLPILTRYLSAAEYGQVAIYQTVIAGLNAFIGISAQGAASIKYYDGNIIKEDLKIFIGSCILILISTSSLVLFVAIAFAQSISELLAIDTEWIFIAVIASSATFVIAIRMTQWQVRNEAKKYAIMQVSQGVLNMGLSLLLVVCLVQGAAGRMWVLSIVPVIFFVISLILLHEDNLLGFGWRPKYIREILSFGIPLIPHSLGVFLLSSIDRLIINEKLGLEQVGIYMVAVQLVAIMGLVFDAINNAYVPWLFERLKRDQMDEKKKIVRWTYVYCLILLCIAGLAFIIGPSILILIAGEKYSAGDQIIGWLALGQAFQGMYLMVTNYIFYSKRTALLSASTIVAGLINLGLLFMLINFMGLQGAAIAYAISMALKFLMTWFVANLRHPMPWFNFNRSSSYAK
jgi:O-antigen/teichoic acid export membrane protein